MTTTTPALTKEAIDALITEWITPDPFKPGRHNAVFRGSRTHLWAVLAQVSADRANLADVAAAYELPEEAIQAALAFRERHRALFDADQILRDEEWSS